MECGDSTATFLFEYEQSLRREITAEMNRVLGNDRKARVYVVCYDDDKQHVTGTFILNGRKAAPWAGFGTDGGETDEDDEAA